MKTIAKTWTKDEIKNLILTNDVFVCRSVVKIFERQTEDEKQADQTGHSNGIGFNGTDAFILSQFAKQYMSKKYLSEKQIALSRKKIVKYSRQLVEIANSLQPIAA